MKKYIILLVCLSAVSAFNLYGSGRSITYKLYGFIESESGLPMPDLFVAIYEKTMDDEVLIGNTKTDDNGHYQIIYKSSSNVMILIKVYDGNNTLLYESDALKPLTSQSLNVVVEKKKIKKSKQ